MKEQKFFTAALVLFFLPALAVAQVTASVVGTVQDTSGAVIPGAAVTVKNLETGAARAVATDDRGYYRALSLPVGRYEVAAEKTGFKRGVRTGITLVVGQEAVVNLSMEVGEVQQAVTVTAEAPIVNTTTASTSGLVGEREVKDLPLNGRSFDNLITLNPGTNSDATQMRQANTGKPPGNMFNISGRRAEENLFLLNGIEYTSASLYGSTPGGASGQLLGIDAVREFSVQASTYGAEYGKRAGGQINVVTMSGTNQLHGTMFDFLRNSDLDAANFFTNKGNQPIPPFRRNDFGAAAGGPIRKDKTFIFGNYEGIRQRLTNTVTSFVPNANARLGLLPCVPNGTPACGSSPAGTLVNVGLAPGMNQYFILYPQANGLDLGGGIAQTFNPGLNPVREDFGIVRVDHLFSEKDTLGGTYTVDDGSSQTANANPFSAQILTLRSQVASLEETHTFSPSIINTARIGFSRGSFFTDAVPTVPVPASLSLIAGRPIGQITVGGSALTGGSLTAYGSIAVDQVLTRNLFTYSDSLQITKGKHLISLGGWAQRVQFNGLFIASAYGGVTFNDLTHFLQGQAFQLSGTISIIKRYSRQWEGAWYAADTIKLSPKLTMTLGVRHEFTDGWHVGPLGQPVNYLVGTAGCLAGVPQCVQTTPITNTTSMFSDNNAKWLFGPRIGLAWDPFGNGKTSMHAGYGMYYSLIDDLVYTIPQPSNFTLTNVQYPYQLQPGTPLPAGALGARGIYPPDAKTPTVQMWSFTVEQQLTSSTALSVGYVGSHGYHFLAAANLNPTFSVICPASPCPANLSAGTKYFPSAAPSARLNPSLSGSGFYASLSNSSYNALQVDLRQRFAKGLIFRANYSFARALDNDSAALGGVFANCPYTIMDGTNAARDHAPACFDITHRFAFSGSYELPIGQGKAFLGGIGGAANKVLGGWKLNGIVSVQTGLPFTPFVGFGNSRDGGTGASERPNLFPGRNPGNTISGVTAGCTGISPGQTLGTPNRWFDPCAFILPPTGTYGNVGKNTLRSPGLSNVDMSLFKDTRLTERMNLQFRAEVFNLFNHANFAPPSASLFTSTGSYVPTAGVINNTMTFSRQIQLGLKLVF